MNPDYEKDLEAAIHRELAALPQLSAPAGLSARVMAAVALRERPWYRQSWQMWPFALQATSLAFLALVFLAICYGGWRAPELGFVSAVFTRVRDFFTVATSASTLVEALLGALVATIRNSSTGLLIGCAAAAALGYAACVGLGTFYFRLALARSKN